MNISSTQDLYIATLRDLVSVEKQLIAAIPKLAKKAKNKELASALTQHLKVTKEHAKRLEQIFDAMDESAGRKKCEGIAGIIQEGTEMIHMAKDPMVRDVVITSGAQHAEHYEIAGYRSAILLAKELGQSDAAYMLGQTLSEEEAADEKLAALARQSMPEPA